MQCPDTTEVAETVECQALKEWKVSPRACQCPQRGLGTAHPGMAHVRISSLSPRGLPPTSEPLAGAAPPPPVALSMQGGWSPQAPSCPQHAGGLVTLSLLQGRSSGAPTWPRLEIRCAGFHVPTPVLPGRGTSAARRAQSCRPTLSTLRGAPAPTTGPLCSASFSREGALRCPSDDAGHAPRETRLRCALSSPLEQMAPWTCS